MSGPIIPDGYVLYARAILESRLWMCGPDTLRVATWLLLQARSSRKPKKFPGFDQQRGDVVTSYGSIAEGTEWFENRKPRQYSRQKVSRIIKQLIEIGFCKTISDTYGTHLSICKYDTYQNPSNYKSDNSGTTVEQHRDNTETTPGTNNNVENVDNEKKENKLLGEEPSPSFFANFWRAIEMIEGRTPSPLTNTADLKAYIGELEKNHGKEVAKDGLTKWLVCYEYYYPYIKKRTKPFDLSWPKDSIERIKLLCVKEHNENNRTEPIEQFCYREIAKRRAS